MGHYHTELQYWGGGCIKVYVRVQIAEKHLNFNTHGNIFSFSAKNLHEMVTLLQLHCNLR